MVATPALAEITPYQARVIVAGASVFSGPGDKFYVTDTLSQGDLLEVYRDARGGWLGIRPPINSFSWVAARDLIVKDGGLAEVTRDNVPSRIGSRVNDKRNASQVRLKKGEAVEVVGEATVAGEKWCKIAPPAGEFRWIQSSLVEKVGPIRTKTGAANDTKAAEPKKDTTTSASSTAPSNVVSANAGSTPPPPLLSNSEQSKPTPQPPEPTGGQPQPASPTGDLTHDIAAVEVRLSRMASAPTNLWNTERLERDVAQLMGRAQTQAERDQLRAMQEKIAHFAEIGRKANQTVATSSGPAPITPTPGGPATAANGVQYDAVGILRPVVSRRPGAPQFALVDDRGQVLSFVTPTPDLNLQPYLGRKIGVVGNRGYMPEFQRASVTAARVTPLNDRLVR